MQGAEIKYDSNNITERQIGTYKIFLKFFYVTQLCVVLFCLSRFCVFHFHVPFSLYGIFEAYLFSPSHMCNTHRLEDKKNV